MLRKHFPNSGHRFIRWSPLTCHIRQQVKSPHSFDCCDPKEAALLSSRTLKPTHVTEYQEKLILSLSIAGALAIKLISKSQKCQKTDYDKLSQATLDWENGF